MVNLFSKLLGVGGVFTGGAMLDTFKQEAAAQSLNDAIKADSYISYTQSARVEPVCYVDRTIAFDENITEVLRATLSIFSGYYMQAWTIGMNVGSIDVLRTLDQLNPNRDVLKNASTLISTESVEEAYKYGLERAQNQVSVESLGLEASPEVEPDTDDKLSAKFDRASIDASTSAANLSIGHLLSLDAESNGHKATIPIAVRLITSLIEPESLVGMFTGLAKNRTMRERYTAWRTGQLHFIRDLVFTQDLIDAHRKNLINDKTGAYREVYSRKNKNFLSSVLSNRISVGTASNIAVISQDTADLISREMLGSIEKYAVRQKIFEASYLMLMVVYDPAYEAVTIYHRGIRLATELQLSQIKFVNKKGGPDISEVLKAYRDVTAPRY